ncbi:Chromosome partition protein MukB, partial [Haemophilus influenzae]
KLRVVIKRLI